VSNYRIKPVVVSGYNSFKLEKLKSFLFIGSYWEHLGYYLTRAEAEKAIEHIEGRALHVSTEPR
jgi:hypothetical protein